MKIKPGALFLTYSLIIVIFAVFYSLSKQTKTILISPIAGKQVKALGKKITPTLTLTPTPTITPDPKPRPTFEPTLTPANTPTPAPVIVAPADLENLFVKYSSEYSIDKNLLVKIANCESGLNPNATNRDYAGLYQFAEPLWTRTRQLTGQNTDSNLRFNAEESIRTAAFMISQGHLNIWPTCSK